MRVGCRRASLLLSALLFAASAVDACDVCDGIAGKKVASGEVLEISDEGLRRLAPAHPLLSLLLYKPWDTKTKRLQTAYDDAAAALIIGAGLPVVMAQIDVDQFPVASAVLDVADVEMPTIRVLRGDPRFGYPLRHAGVAAADIAQRLRSELETPDAALLRLPPDAIAFFETEDGPTRVLANASKKNYQPARTESKDIKNV